MRTYKTLDGTLELTPKGDGMVDVHIKDATGESVATVISTEWEAKLFTRDLEEIK
jgi:hypothetical protein